MIALMWQFTSKIAETFGRILVMIVLARILDPYSFGVASASLVVLSFCQTMTQIGIAPALIQRSVIEDKHINTAFHSSIIIGLLTSLIIWISAPQISTFFGMSELSDVVRAIALCFPLSAPAMVAEALLMRDLSFKKLAAIDTVSFAVGYSILGISLALMGFGVWALVWAQIAQVCIRALLILIASHHKLSLQYDYHALRDLLGFGVGHTLAELGNFSALQSDNVIVGRMLGPIDLGLYSRAYTLLAQPSRLIGTAFDRVLFPAMSTAQDNDARLLRAQMRGLAGIALVTIPGSFLLIILAPELISILLGSEWSAMVAPFQILAATMLFRTSYKVSDSVVRARGMSFQRAARQWIYALFVAIGASLGTFYGLSGVALGVSVAIFVNFVVMMNLSLRATGGEWKSIVRSYTYVLAGFSPGMVTSLLLVQALRMADLGPFILFFSVSCVAVLTMSLTALAFPKFFGPDCSWLIEFFLSKISRRSSRSSGSNS